MIKGEKAKGQGAGNGRKSQVVPLYRHKPRPVGWSIVERMLWRVLAWRKMLARLPQPDQELSPDEPHRGVLPICASRHRPWKFE